MARKPGPASPYSPKLRKRVLELIAEGLSLAEACDKLALPRRTARSWLERDPTFEHAYEAARHERVDSLFERYIRRAMEATEITAQAERAGLNPSAAATSLRTELDSLKWGLSKLLPSRFGDRVQLAGDLEQPLIPEPTDPAKIALGVLALLAQVKRAEAVTIDNAAEPSPHGLPPSVAAPPAFEPAPVFAPGSPDPLWSRDAVAQPHAGTILGRPAEPFAATSEFDRFPGAVEPTLGGASQKTAAMIREEQRVADRRAGREFDVATGKVVSFYNRGRQ